MSESSPLFGGVDFTELDMPGVGDPISFEQEREKWADCATHSASFSISSSKLIDPVQKIFTTKITYSGKVFLLQNSSESYSTLQFGPESLCLSVTPIPLEEVHLLLQLFGVVGLKKKIHCLFSLLMKSVLKHGSSSGKMLIMFISI